MSSAISSTTSGTGTSSTGGAGSAVVTSTGIGSGLDISAIVSELTTAEGAAQQTQITNQENTLNAQLSAFGTFSSALSTLQATLSTLEDPSQLAGFTASVVDTSVATASATSDAVAGSYSLQVQNLATAASLSSQAFASASSTVGTGTIKISVGGASTSITIDDTDNTLSGIAAAINGAANNPGVTASIISTSSGARLVLSGTTTGAANAIAVKETDGGAGLSGLTYAAGATTNGLTQTQAAQDANFTLNGYAGSSSSNVVSSAISGVTFNLLKASAASTPTTLTIAPSTSDAATSIGTFVTALNGVLTAIQSLTSYDPTTQVAGSLNGNATIQSFQNQLENILDTINSSNAGGVSSLANLGISADADLGTYDSDSTQLTNVLTSSLSSVQSLLGGSNGLATQINSLITSYTGAGGLVSTVTQGLQSGLQNAATAQTQLTAELATYSATLTTQYNAMDAAVASLKETQTYLNAEFNPSSSSSSSSSTSSLSAGQTSA